MTEFIVLTLLFLDNNGNNIFDNGDEIIKVSNNNQIEQNVFCKIPNTSDTRLCGYSSKKFNTDLIDEVSLLADLKGKHFIYNQEVFEEGFIQGRVLYAEYVDGKYLFLTDEKQLNKDNVIYSLSNDDGIFFNELLKRIIIGIIVLGCFFGAWLVLFPKKVEQNG